MATQIAGSSRPVSYLAPAGGQAAPAVLGDLYLGAIADGVAGYQHLTSSDATEPAGPASQQALRVTSPGDEPWPAALDELWDGWRDRGDVYIGRFTGWYCGECRQFYADHEVDDGPSCPVHWLSVTKVDEDCWFFRLASLRDRVQAHHDAVEERTGRPFVVPDEWMSHIRRRLAGAVADVPLVAAPAGPRGDGVEMTNAPLLALAASGSDLDPDGVCVVPADYIWYGAVVWPAMLLAAGLQPPAGVVTGQPAGDGRQGAAGWPQLPPQPVADAIGAETLRYLMLRTPAGSGPVTADALLDRYQDELATGLGNLASRTTAVAANAEPDGVVERPAAADDPFDFDHVVGGLRGWPHPERVLEAVATLVRAGNAYLESHQPWRQDPPERARTLWHALELCRVLAHLTSPVLTDFSRKLRALLGVDEPAHWPVWGGGSRFQARAGSEPLFRSINGSRRRRLLRDWEQAAQQSAPKARITPDDFGRLDLRVARIAAAEPVTTDGGVVLRVRLDLGREQRDVFSTKLAQVPEPQALTGSMVVYLANLPAVEIAGFASQGLILAAHDAQATSPVGFDHTHEPGAVMF